MKQKTLLASAIALALFVPAWSVAAQSATPDTSASSDNTKTLQTITVTGSRIRSVDVETSQPVTTLTRQDIQKSGYTTVDQLLANLPDATSDIGRATNNNVATEAGSTTVDIHYLGAQRTLVLVNGRRWSTQLDGTTDISTIPLSIIDHVDILKDGASTLYGSDAVSGVVNIVTLDHFDGVEAHVNYGQYSQGDGTQKTADVTAGTHTDKASFIFNVQHTEGGSVADRDRDISQIPYFGHPGFGLSSYTGQGSYADPVTGNRMSLVNGVPTPFNLAQNGFNTQQYTDLLQATKRDSVFAQMKYDFNSFVSLTSHVAYNHRTTDGQLAATPLSIGPNAGTTALEQGLSLSGQSVYNPFGTDVTDILRRTVEAGPRSTENSSDDLHLDLGLNGGFDAGSHHFDWDATYSYDHLNGDLLQNNLVNVANLAQGIGPSFFDANGVARCGTPGAVIVGCTPVDLLNAHGGLTPQQLAFISYNDRGSFDTTTHDFTANITGDIAPLPGGNLSFAAGFEYRRLQGKFDPDSLTQAGLSSGNQATPTSGGYHTKEEYLEFSAPLLKDLPGAQELTLDVSGRHSQYSNFGSTNNYKYSFTWHPIKDLLVRGSYAQGFRAPTINDLFAGDLADFAVYNDPCDMVNGTASSNAATRANCLAHGVPANFQQPGGYGAQTLQPFSTGGNPNLQPETSVSKTAGLVYSPSWFQGFDVSLDYYRVTIKNTITTLDATTILDQCYSQNNQAFCGLLTRNATGAVSSLLESSVNIGSIKNEGFDFTASYRLPETAIGNFRISLDSDYTKKFEQTVLPGQAPQGLVGLYNGGAPVFRLRANVMANWSMGPWNAQWRVRYQSGLAEDCIFDDACNRPNYFNPTLGVVEPLNRIGAIAYNDIQVGYEFPWKGTLSVGVNNVFDRNPPVLYGTTAQSSFDANYYDLPGRFWFVDYRQRF